MKKDFHRLHNESPLDKADYNTDYLKSTLSDFQDALYYIDSNTNLEEWLVCLSAGKTLFGHNSKSILEDWSKQGSQYNKAKFNSHWKGAKSSNGFVISFFNKAKSYGWNPNKTGFTNTARPIKTNSTPTPTEKPKQNSELLTRWNNAKPCTNHKYLDNKGVKPYNLKVNDQGFLLIPSYSTDGLLIGLQWIDEIGRKQFYKGSDRSSPSYHTIHGDSSQGRIFVEGYANGSKLHSITGKTIIVCFDAGMIPKVAKAIGQPNDVVFADNDIRVKDPTVLLDNFNSYATGHKKAHESGLNFYLPTVRGADACDMAEDEILNLLSKNPISTLPLIDVYKINSHLHADKTKDQLFKALSNETDYQTICELCASIARRMTLQVPNVYRVIDIYAQLFDATVSRLSPIQLDRILERALKDLLRREDLALSLVKVKSWGNHKTNRVTTLEGLSPDYKGMIIVNSPTGTKKTHLMGRGLINEAKQQNKVSESIAHRVSLLADTCGNLEIDSYKDQDKNSIESVEHLGICFHSLAKPIFKSFNNRVTHLFIDEVSQVIRSFSDTNLEKDKKAQAIYSELKKIIRQAECIVVCDASIDQDTLDFLEECRPNEQFQVFEILPFNEDKVATILQNESELLNTIVNRIKDGQGVWLATDSAAWGKSVINSAVLEHCKNKIFIDADSKKEDPRVQAFLDNPNEESKKYDLVIASPTISSGVSINHDKFSIVAGYFTGHSVTPTDAYQMLGRVRQCKEFYLCISDRGHVDIGEQSHILGTEKVFESENKTFRASKFELLHADIRHKEEQAKLAFSASLLWILKQKKFTLKRGLSDRDIYEEIRKAEKAELKQLIINQLTNAPCISEDQLKTLESQSIINKDELIAIKAFKTKQSLGYHYTYQLTEQDLELNPSDFNRFNALRNLTTASNDADLDTTVRKFDDEKAKACQEVFKHLKADSTFTLEDAQKIMAYLIQHRFRFVRLGLLPKFYGRIYRNKKGEIITHKFKMGIRQFNEVLSRFGIKTERTKESKKNDSNRLQLTDEVKVSHFEGLIYITNSESETKSGRDNIYKVNSTVWEDTVKHADRLASKKAMKPLPVIQNIREELKENLNFSPINDSPYDFQNDFDWIDTLPIQKTP
jgi:putative DNA primase/helicase